MHTFPNGYTSEKHDPKFLNGGSLDECSLDGVIVVTNAQIGVKSGIQSYKYAIRVLCLKSGIV